MLWKGCEFLSILLSNITPFVKRKHLIKINAALQLKKKIRAEACMTLENLKMVVRPLK